MVNSQKWLGEGAKGPLSPGSENRVAPVQNGVAPVQNGFRMVQKTLGRLLLPELKLPFAPSPYHFWEFTIFGLSPRAFGLQPYSTCHLGPVIIKPVGRILESAIRTRCGENAENAEGPSHPWRTRVWGDSCGRKRGKWGHENSENAENAADWL